MTTFSLDTADMQMLVFSLATDVCFVHLNDTGKRVWETLCHAASEMLHHPFDSAVWDSGLLNDSPHCPFTEKHPNAVVPFRFCAADVWYGAAFLAPFTTTTFAFALGSTENPRTSKGAVRAGFLRHIGGKVRNCSTLPSLSQKQKKKATSCGGNFRDYPFHKKDATSRVDWWRK